MNRHNALIISHADADGHLIAEQVRRNLSLTNIFNLNVVVDPSRTRDHKSWLKLDQFPEIERADFVFFVDMMFAPGTFEVEADALVRYLDDYPQKRFFLIDHHPLPLRRLNRAKNLRTSYRPDVFDCAIGPRSGMMVVAAICEHQRREVADIRRPIHDTIALGVRRAAAEGGSLPGNKLLALLKADRWDALLQLGQDSSQFHRLPRGRRPQSEPLSDALISIDREADDLLHHRSSTKHDQRGGPNMSYDTDVGQERFLIENGNRVRHNDRSRARDLEALVTLLEVAALSLSTEPGAVFTIDQLVREAIDIAGEDISIRDIRIVLQKGKTVFLEHLGGKEYCLK